MRTMRVRATALISTALLLVAACGGKSTPPTTTTTTTPDTAGALDGLEGTPGTTGYAGLDWGITEAGIKERFPSASAGATFLSITGNHGGKPGVTTFEFQDDKLHRISVSFTDDYPSMEACLEVWKTVREAVNGKLGAGSSENGAAYWDSTTYNIVLSCDPGEEDQGVMSMSYAQPQE
ncbi:MAG TPA: hypothetical protein VM261_35410 [Kofleriaceae bacterium]|nr:hypothetical protein [Kofleriaceae bacterium]